MYVNYYGDICDSPHKPLTEDAHFPLPKNVHKEMAIMLSSGIIPYITQNKISNYMEVLLHV